MPLTTLSGMYWFNLKNDRLESNVTLILTIIKCMPPDFLYWCCKRYIIKNGSSRLPLWSSGQSS
jgi:hypothetical protein